MSFYNIYIYIYLFDDLIHRLERESQQHGQRMAEEKSRMEREKEQFEKEKRVMRLRLVNKDGMVSLHGGQIF